MWHGKGKPTPNDLVSKDNTAVPNKFERYSMLRFCQYVENVRLLSDQHDSNLTELRDVGQLAALLSIFKMTSSP